MSIVNALNEKSGGNALTIEKAIRELELGGDYTSTIGPKKTVFFSGEVEVPETEEGIPPQSVMYFDKLEGEDAPDILGFIFNGETYELEKQETGLSQSYTLWYYGCAADGPYPTFEEYPFCITTSSLNHKWSLYIKDAGTYDIEVSITKVQTISEGFEALANKMGLFPIVFDRTLPENASDYQYICSRTYDELIALMGSYSENTPMPIVFTVLNNHLDGYYLNPKLTPLRSDYFGDYISIECHSIKPGTVSTLQKREFRVYNSSIKYPEFQYNAVVLTGTDDSSNAPLI